MADFGLLQPMPNFAQAALGGYQAGQGIAKERATQAALGGIDLERPETITPLLRLDPSTGAALLGASARMKEMQRDADSRAALTDYLLQAQRGRGASSSRAPAAPPVPDIDSPVNQTAGEQPMPADGGDIVVTAPQVDPAQAAAENLMRVDPQAYLQVQGDIARMDDAQRKRVADMTSAMGAAAQTISGLPYEQRQAAIAQMAPTLLQHGVAADQIAGFDPTDEAIAAITGQALGVKGILDRQDKERAAALDQSKFDETRRHNRATEGTAAGALNLARQREGRVAAGSAGEAGGMSTDALLSAAGLR